MAQDKSTFPNVDNSNPAAYPSAQIQDNTGTGNGTPVSQLTNSDIQEFFGKILRLAGIAPNGSYDNEINGFQFVDAMRALAGKNDIIRSITAAGTNLNIDTKLAAGRLLTGEVLIASANADFANEITITGIDATVETLVSLPVKPYKASDLLLLVQTAGGIQIYVLTTGNTLNRQVAELGYLLAATDVQEIAGTRADLASTPASNLAAFTARVNGVGSGAFLATADQNGILSKLDKAKIDSFAPRNKGYISGVDCGGLSSGTNLSVSGNIASAVVQAGGSPNETLILVTLQNGMNGTNYLAKMFLESQGNISFDNDCLCPVFKPVSATQFTLGIQEGNPPGSTVTQNVRIHIEANNL